MTTFNVPLSGDSQTLVRWARTAIMEAKGTFNGDANKGTFSMPSPLGDIAGSYQSTGSALAVTILQKPWLLPYVTIERELEKRIQQARSSGEEATQSVAPATEAVKETSAPEGSSSRAQQVARCARALMSGKTEATAPEGPGFGAEVEAILAWHGLGSDRRPGIEQTLTKVYSGADLSAADTYRLEAIILPTERPVADVRDGRITSLPEGEFFDIFSTETTRARVETALASVGCIMLPDDRRLPYGGTGFVVGQGLVMTNRHVARLFADGVGTKRLAFLRGQTAAFTPGREDADATRDVQHTVRRVVMIHPYWDMALLEIPDLPLAPLALDPVDPSTRTRVVVVGYPARDPRNDRATQDTVFRNRFFVKRVAPGYVAGRRVVASFDSNVSASMHDSSTLGGNSGSALIDVQSGRVVGLHFAGAYLDANFAVPALELARDPRVVAAGVSFTSTSATKSPPWEDRWRTADAVGAPAETPAGLGTSRTIRVSVPIEITVRDGQIVTDLAAMPEAFEEGAAQALAPALE